MQWLRQRIQSISYQEGIYFKLGASTPFKFHLSDIESIPTRSKFVTMPIQRKTMFLSGLDSEGAWLMDLQGSNKRIWIHNK